MSHLIFSIFSPGHQYPHYGHATGPSTPTLLGLPPEIRRLIFTCYFRSVRIRQKLTYPYEAVEDQLAILRVCHQLYHESEPLVLPNVQLFCYKNTDVINTLTKMSSEQVSQLRHMVVHHCPVGFNLSSKEKSTGVSSDRKHDTNDDNDDDNDDDNVGEDPVRYFHLGAILGLFPGLQLDILEVFCEVRGGPYTDFQTTDCFGSLLGADGYRQLWMRASEGDGGAWVDTPSSFEWKDYIATKFKPYNGWVRMRLPRHEWRDVGRDTPQGEFWHRAQEAGFTLVKKIDSPNDSDEDGQSMYGHRSEDVADIVVDRGDADFAVKKDGDQVLRCIERDYLLGETPAFFKSTSDALRKLFKDHSLETIWAMDGFDDGTLNYWDLGDNAYSRRY
ncbi:hypothetical protein BDDG_03276 [Blastomyces dermatitidis ATCC 18188]|uniref:F-box domain-containing protein n=1 Tax=Ajellomyces dermatitidis (strain ATCC 18188 / CBS 674.68) TaxID=653446 RepID=F2TAS2_AJEDA|nr:hypothetical protein BDDG_03276 [Blastomyces dermatitidis ATCC 18188]